MADDSPPGAPDGQEHRPAQPWFPPAEPGGYGPAAGYGGPEAGGHGEPQAGRHSEPPPGPGGYGYGQGWYGPPGAGGQGPPPPPGPGGYGYGQGWYGPPGPGGGSWQPPPVAPQPGIIPLRPIGVGEILDGGFTALRRNPKATFGLAALFLTISGVITTGLAILIRPAQSVPVPPAGAPVPAGQVSPIVSQDARFAVPAAIISVVFALIVQLLLTGVLTTVVGQAVLGKRLSPGEAWRLARPRLPALIGATLLSGLILVLALLPGVALIAILAVARAPTALIVLGAVAAVIATVCLLVWLGISLSLTVPAVVLENQRPASALARSWRLVRRSFWRVFGISLLAWIIVIVASLVLEIPFEVVSAVFRVGGALGAIGAVTVPSLIVAAIGSIAAGTVTRPFAAAVTVLLYVDLRMRKEGLDLVLRTAGSGPGTASEPGSLWQPGYPPPAPGAPGQQVPGGSMPGHAPPAQGMPPQGTPPQGTPGQSGAGQGGPDDEGPPPAPGPPPAW